MFKSSLVVVLALALTACGAQAAPSAGRPAPSPATSSSAPAVSSPAAATSSAPASQWDQTLAAAKREGKVAISSQAGDGYRQVYQAFQAKYGITVELLQGNVILELAPRITTERKAGQFLWDVVQDNPTTLYTVFKSMTALDPLKPALILPEVLDDRYWIGGFDAGWADQQKSLAYSISAYVGFTVHVNRQFVPETQLNSIDQLWDPRWKGKIALIDPRTPSVGANRLTTLLTAKGEDRLRGFLTDQQPVVTQDRRQIGEWLVRGQYPVVIGVISEVLTTLSSQGLDTKAIEALAPDDPGAAGLSLQGIGLFNQTPHPNATKVLLNWFLGQEGQTLWAQKTGFNSRRSDVPVADKAAAVDPKKTYVAQTEDTYPNLLKTIAVAKELIK